MKIKVYNSILTFDEKQKTTVALSSDNDKIILPFLEITNPSLIKEEIKYYIKSLFYNAEIKHIETIIVSCIEIQNDFLLNYVKSIDSYNYNQAEDLCLFTSIILNEKFKTQAYYWLPVDFNISVSDRQPINLLIDYVFKNVLS
jgi:hypothetical protein